jgi:hypothetical protein
MFTRRKGIDPPNSLPTIQASLLAHLYDPRHVIILIDPVDKAGDVLVD